MCVLLIAYVLPYVIFSDAFLGPETLFPIGTGRVSRNEATTCCLNQGVAKPWRHGPGTFTSRQPATFIPFLLSRDLKLLFQTTSVFPSLSKIFQPLLEKKVCVWGVRGSVNGQFRTF
jgi:hypothetical protein